MHKFTPDGQLIKSWGEPGDGPGQFRLPHGIWIDRQDRVLVADRENDRVQAFTQEGEYITTWPSKLIGPALFYIDSEDIVYIPEHNGGLFSVLSPDGEIITQWGSELHRPCHGAWALGIENSLFHVKDDSFREARLVLRQHRRGAVVGLLRNAAITLLRGTCHLWPSKDWQPNPHSYSP